MHRGIDLAALIELTNPGPAFYGVGGARIAAQDGATVRLDPTGVVHCATGVGEQGQGTETIFAQIVADTLGLPMASVRVLTGDTAATPYGGGTWARAARASAARPCCSRAATCAATSWRWRPRT